MSKKVIYSVAIVVVFLLAIFTGAYFYDLSKSFVAKVGGEKITTVEYKYFLADIMGQSEKVANITDLNSRKSFWSKKMGNEKAEDYAKNTAMNSALKFKIQVIKAKENGIKVEKNDKKVVDSYIDSIVNFYGGKAKTEVVIKKFYGFSLDKFRSIQLDLTLVGKFAKLEKNKIKYTDEELKKYYDKNRASIDSITERQILFSTKSSSGSALTPEKKNEVKKKAEDMLALIKTGKDFSTLARMYSEDMNTKDKGGLVVLTKGKAIKEIDTWCFNEVRKTGDVGIVESANDGYYIVKIEKRTTFNDVKDMVKTNFLNESYNSLMSNWKKDKKYNLIKNDSVLKSIKILDL